MRIVLFGPPGVGKGTYASKLKDMYNLPHISTGDLFRENLSKETPIGLKAKEYIDQGKLVSDDVTIEMLKLRIEDEKGFFLDGFPRTIAQAESLKQLIKIDVVINFFADRNILTRRISGRRICRQCQAVFNVETKKPEVENVCDGCKGELYQRSDEMPDVVENRLKVYENETKPVIDYYKEQGLLHDVDANLDMSHPDFHVIDDVKKILDTIQEVV